MIGSARLAGAGLACAAATIVALALLARFELDREAALHREVIAALEVKDSLEALRAQVADLRASARRWPPAAADRQAIERRSVEIEAELAYLAQQPLQAGGAAAFAELMRTARALTLDGRTLAAEAGVDGPALARRIDTLGSELHDALERTLRAQRRRINDSTVAQIRVGEALRGYVGWLVAGSIAVLAGLFGFYRWAKLREARALERIAHLAHHDTVTDLPNRALLQDRLAQEVARARRNQLGFAVVMLDLDGFKGVNDRWGHAAGDEVLARAAERLRACMRASDTVGRLGGDEFLAILPDVGDEGAVVVAEKVRGALEQPFAISAGAASLSASVGIAFYPRDGEDPDTLQRAADAALYEAKRGGKNRVLARAAQAPRAGAATLP